MLTVKGKRGKENNEKTAPARTETRRGISLSREWTKMGKGGRRYLARERMRVLFWKVETRRGGSDGTPDLLFSGATNRREDSKI